MKWNWCSQAHVHLGRPVCASDTGDIWDGFAGFAGEHPQDWPLSNRPSDST